MKILVTICGRGGSKGIPGKNTKQLNGKPLLAYTIDAAKRFSIGKDVVVGLSTDSSDIVAAAGEFGLRTEYRRPSELAGDQVGKLDVITALLNYEEMNSGDTFDVIIDLDITSPLRTTIDMEQALAMLLADEEALNIFSVNVAARNPYFNMVERNSVGYYELCKKGLFLTRQSAPPVFEMNASFYIFRRSFFDKGLKGAITDRSLVYPMPHICFDLDHSLDFEFMSFLIEQKKLDFVL